MSDYGDSLRKERRLQLAQQALPPEMLIKYDGISFATKTEGGKSFPASDYAYVPDAKTPSTWKLRLTATPGGTPDPQIVGAAIAALGKGFRGNKVQIPDADLAAVKAKVKTAWIKANPDKDPKKDLPAVVACGMFGDEEDSSDDDTEVPWQGPIAFEDEMTGDNRLFEVGSVYWDADTLPYPFRWVRQDQGGHKSASQIGRVDNVWKDGTTINASGVIFAGVPGAKDYLELMELGGAGGVSIDADNPKFTEVRIGPENDQIRQSQSPGEPDQNILQKFSKIRLRGITAVDIPAFNKAKITIITLDPSVEVVEGPDEMNNPGFDNPNNFDSPSPEDVQIEPINRSNIMDPNSPKPTEDGTRWYTSHAPVQDGTRWYSTSWWAGEPPRTAGTRWYTSGTPVQEGTRWYSNDKPVKQEADWQPAVEGGTRWYSNKSAMSVDNGSEKTSGAGTRWYGTRWYSEDQPKQESGDNGTRWYGTRWYADEQPTQGGTRWYSSTPPVQEGTRWYANEEPVKEGTRWYNVDDAGTRWYEDEAGTRWYDNKANEASVKTVEELADLPPALKAQLVKKLTAQAAKEKDPTKKAALLAKVKSYS